MPFHRLPNVAGAGCVGRTHDRGRDQGIALNHSAEFRHCGAHVDHAGGDVHLPGADLVHGGAGADTIHTRDGEADTVDCGPGRDTALLDAQDLIFDATPASPNGSCEIVKRAAPKSSEDRQENKRESPPDDSRQS